jgi:hypothetical protein
MHLILPPGKMADGTIRTLRIQGALSDAMAWFGAEDIVQDIRDIKEGRKSIGDQAKEVAVAPAIKLFQGAQPFVKAGYETLTKKSLFPEPARARPIRDRTEHVLRLLSLDKIYRRVSGKPGKGKTILDKVVHDAMATWTYTADPEEAAYNEARSMAFKYKEDIGKGGGDFTPSDKANALYYYRQALKWGDGPAAYKYLKLYATKYDGTIRGLKTSIQRAHPLGTLAKKDRLRFIYQLSPKDRETVRRAIRWYRDRYKGGKP